MQVNGTGEGEFDSIVAQGDVALGGTLEVLVNNLGDDSDVNPTYTPTLGDTFDLITAVGASPDGDYDGDGTVDADDLATWTAGFGAAGGAADGNGDGVVDALDYAIWRENLGATGGPAGTITGDFSTLTITDPDSVMATAGLAFQLNVSANLVQLEVIAASGAAVVPEPMAITMLLATIAASAATRRRIGA